MDHSHGNLSEIIANHQVLPPHPWFFSDKAIYCTQASSGKRIGDNQRTNSILADFRAAWDLLPNEMSNWLGELLVASMTNPHEPTKTWCPGDPPPIKHAHGWTLSVLSPTVFLLNRWLFISRLDYQRVSTYFGGLSTQLQAMRSWCPYAKLLTHAEFWSNWWFQPSWTNHQTMAR